MKSRNIYIPENFYSHNIEGHFNWNLNGTVIEAEHTVSRPYRFSGDDPYWVISGQAGSQSERNNFVLSFAVPYHSNDVLERTYTLEDGLMFWHMYSLPDYPYAIDLIDADSAEVTIRLDPIAQTAQGDYKAIFNTRRLAPSGTFKLKNFTRTKNQQDGEHATLVGGAV